MPGISTPNLPLAGAIFVPFLITGLFSKIGVIKTDGEKQLKAIVDIAMNKEDLQRIIGGILGRIAAEGI